MPWVLTKRWQMHPMMHSLAGSWIVKSQLELAIMPDMHSTRLWSKVRSRLLRPVDASCNAALAQRPQPLELRSRPKAALEMEPCLHLLVEAGR